MSSSFLSFRCRQISHNYPGDELLSKPYSASVCTLAVQDVLLCKRVGKKKKKVLYSTALSKSNLILKYKKIPFLFKTATTLSFVFK